MQSSKCISDAHAPSHVPPTPYILFHNVKYPNKDVIMVTATVNHSDTVPLFLSLSPLSSDVGGV